MNLIFASNVGLIENMGWQSNLTAIRYGSVSAGDINNDNNMDIVLTGCLSAGGLDCNDGTISKIYINNGSTLIENSTWQSNLTGLGWSSTSLGDIDNDGDLDLALVGCTSATDAVGCTGDLLAKIYINNGTSLVESQQWQQNLTGIFRGSIVLGDIDNDGKLDLILTGDTTTARIAKIYINNGTSLVESQQWQQNLTAIRYGNIALGDIDNDGKLDLAFTGQASGNVGRTKIYINNGTSLAESSQWQNNLIQTSESSIIFGDYDNDGDLDLIVIGIGDYLFTYKNNGTTFIEHQKNVGEGGDLGGGLYDGSIGFEDYDNDGDLDFVGMGREDGRNRVYENNASKNYNFTIDSIAGSGIENDNMHSGPLAWVDLDSNTALDLISFGTKTGTGLLAKVYISNASLTKNNTLPTPPNTFTSSYINNQLILTWNNGSDNETPSNGLYYNLMIGNSTQNNTIISGVYGGSSNPTAGYFGNMMQRKNITLNVQLEANKTYNWHVQTIDTGLAKSNWSAIQNFTTSLDTTKPNVTIKNPSPADGLHTTNPFFIFNATVTDANLSNVTLYSDWNGSMIINQTNSTGINGTYIFEKNLTSISDRIYSWYIEANDSFNNSQTSGTRSFYLDRIYPLIYLESPSNASTWSSSSTVTFSYNVTDTDIANCSLIINSAVDQTDSSISENTSQTFTKSLSNADYNWNINCTDYVGFTNSSSIYNLTVSYTASSGGGGGGGGGVSKPTPTPPPKKFDIDFSTATGGTLEAKQGDVKTFSFNSQITHKIIISEVTATSIKLIIESKPIILILNIGEIKQIDINKDRINDFEINLISIISGKASFSLTKLSGADIVASEELEKEIRKEALFDVKISLSNLFNVVKTGRDVIAKIEVLNVNNIGQVDVTVDYHITTKEDNKTKLAEGSDTLAVEAVASFVRSLTVPYNIKSGKYLFNVDVKYQGMIMASGNVEFRVIKTYEIFIAVGVIVLIVVAIFVYLWGIKRKEEKDIGVLKKEIKELKKKSLRERFKKWQKKRRKSKKWQ